MKTTKENPTQNNSCHDVRRGCLDCVNKDASITKEPCKSCVRFSCWQDNGKHSQRTKK